MIKYKLKDKILTYLDIGASPTIVSFADDGLYHVFDVLINEVEKTQADKYSYTYLHLNVRYLNNLTIETLEKSIDDELKRDRFPGETVIETIDAGYIVVVILDDIMFLDDPAKLVEYADTLIKRYRNNLRFVYILEHPNVIEYLKDKLPHYSSALDAVIYQRIGENWSTESLVNIFSSQFKSKLSEEEITKISNKSNNHFGTFQKLYRDAVMGSNHIDRYIENMIEEFTDRELQAFEKLKNEEKLDIDEHRVLSIYEKVGLIDNGIISIPCLADKLFTNSSEVNFSSKEYFHLEKLDMSIFTKSEAKILREMSENQEIFSKESIGDLIWGDNVVEKYSEWAIDQRISRLRKKLIENNIKVDIQSIYGKGYQLKLIDQQLS